MDEFEQYRQNNINAIRGVIKEYITEKLRVEVNSYISVDGDKTISVQILLDDELISESEAII